MGYSSFRTHSIWMSGNNKEDYKLYLNWHKCASIICCGDGIIILKELGKMTQYVSNNEFPSGTQ